MTHEDIAKIYHEANGALQSMRDSGRMSEYDHLYWEQMDLKDRQAVIRQVRLALSKPASSLLIINMRPEQIALLKGVVEALRPFSNTKAKAA